MLGFIWKLNLWSASNVTYIVSYQCTSHHTTWQKTFTDVKKLLIALVSFKASSDPAKSLNLKKIKLPERQRCFKRQILIARCWSGQLFNLVWVSSLGSPLLACREWDNIWRWLLGSMDWKEQTDLILKKLRKGLR